MASASHTSVIILLYNGIPQMTEMDGRRAEGDVGWRVTTSDND